ncbi:MAG: M28 family peptidase [Chitinophagales bacterium]|nr:M28 family peptidase [Chitinophagales bacterium]
MNTLKNSTPKQVLTLLVVVTALAFLSSCDWFKKSESTDTTQPEDKPLAAIPAFNADSAFVYIERQLAFGNRVPTSPSHDKCADYLIAHFKQHADTFYIQKYVVTAFDGTKLNSTNIIASFNPQAATRVMLSAHWDSRPFADQDTIDQNRPIPAANDAGSGVAVLMEVAKALQSQKPDIGVDLVLFDSEDYGQPSNSTLPQVENSYCLGSQYWAKNPHVANYKADFGINLDMVGASDAVFMREQVSVTNADWVSQYVWGLADRLGYASLFVPQMAGAITDDHLYVMQGRQFPCIDVIHYSNQSGFGIHWHTHRDDMKWISKNTLQAVGRTVLQAIYQYNSEKKAA